jgi:aminomethyltransferase
LAWLDKQAQGLELSINERSDLAMLALQGPQAKELIQVVSGAQGTAVTALKFFHSQVVNDQWLIARTGYTGEDGFEIMLPNDQAIDCWRQLLQAGAQPCGLGARDTLRLEAGMNLYGCDMDEERSPLEVGLGWTVAWQPAQRDFIGRSALLAERQAGSRLRQLGLVLADKGILRNQQKVLVDGQPLGIITSGSFSPTLGQSIALALVPSQATGPCQVSIRNKVVNCTAVKPPFVRKGQPAYQLIEPESN